MSLLGLIRVPKNVTSSSTTIKQERCSNDVVVKQEPLSINIKEEPKTYDYYIPTSQIKIEPISQLKTEAFIVVKKEKTPTVSTCTRRYIKSEPTISRKKKKKDASTNTVRPNQKKKKYRGPRPRFSYRRKSAIDDAIYVYKALSVKDPFTLSNRETYSLNWAERVITRYNYPINEGAAVGSYVSSHNSPPLSPISYLRTNSELSEFEQDDAPETETTQPLNVRISRWRAPEIEFIDAPETEITTHPEESIEEGAPETSPTCPQEERSETPDVEFMEENTPDIPTTCSQDEQVSQDSETCDTEIFEVAEEVAHETITTTPQQEPVSDMRVMCDTPDSEFCEIFQQITPTTACHSNEQIEAGTLELAIVDFGKPGGRYSFEQGVLIIKTVGELVVNYILKNVGLISPTFGKPSWHDGVVILDCKDQLSYNFVKSIISEMRLWRRAVLRAVPPVKIPFMSKGRLSIPDFGIENDQLLDILKTQNPSINITKWTVLEKNNVITNGLKEYTLLITDPPITLIEGKRMKLFFGAGEVTLKLVDYNLPDEV